MAVNTQNQNLVLSFADFSITDQTLGWLCEQNKVSGRFKSFIVVHLLGSGALVGAGVWDVVIQGAAAAVTLVTGVVTTPFDILRTTLTGKPPLLKAWSWEMTVNHAVHGIKHALCILFVIAENFFVGPEIPREDIFKGIRESERLRFVENALTVQKSALVKAASLKAESTKNEQMATTLPDMHGQSMIRDMIKNNKLKGPPPPPPLPLQTPINCNTKQTKVCPPILTPNRLNTMKSQLKQVKDPDEVRKEKTAKLAAESILTPGDPLSMFNPNDHATLTFLEKSKLAIAAQSENNSDSNSDSGWGD